MGEQDQVLALTARRGPVLPGEVAARADVEDLAQTQDRELSLRRIDEPKPHRRPSLTKKAGARFRISRSWRRTSFSRRKRFSSAATSSCRSAGGTSISRSRRPSIQLRKVESPTPRSAATARRERPLVWASRTASARNSGVNCFLGSAIGDLLHHGKSSPLLRGKSKQPNQEAARAALQHLAEQLHNRWPKLKGFIDATSEDVLAYLTFPLQHRAKLHSTNPLERLNKEIKRRADVVGIFPNTESIQRLIGAVLLEANDEWQLQQRYMPIEGMAGFAPVLPEEAITAIPPKAA